MQARTPSGLRRLARLGAAGALVLLLAACQTAEERAEEHFQSGLALLEGGDIDRALVEFRNVFQLNENHRDARRSYARAVLEQGNEREAYRQYLRLVEQYPDELEGLRALSEMAILSLDWEEAERHGTAAVEMAPDDPRVQIIDVSLRYRTAVEADDPAQRREVAGTARDLVQSHPDSRILSRLLVDNALRDQELEEALALLGRAIALEPENRQFYTTRLTVLNDLGRTDEVEAQLRDMVDRFPEDDTVKSTLIRFLVSRQEIDKAEEFLRSVTDPASEDTDNYMTLIRFLTQLRGPEAALAELETAISVSPNPDLFRSVRAGIQFEQGQREEAIAAMEAVVAGAEPSTQTRTIKVTLAQMLLATGNEVGARRLVEEVLAEDRTQVEALKMRANWLIDADDADGAINALRAALDQNPNDAGALTLMARAHTRNGNRELALDMLSLAVEASNNAPEESIRYAQALLTEERYRAAEDSLVAALRIAPGNIELLAELGRVYVASADWARAEHVEETLRRMENPRALRIANGLQAARLTNQNRVDEAIAFLEGLASADNADLTTQIAVIRARLVGGDTDGALNYAQSLVEEAPENQSARFILAVTQAATGDFAAAEAGYRALLEDNTRSEQLWLELARVMNAQGRYDEAETVVDEALAVLPDGANLLWAKASYLERDRDVEGAIAIYERLYERSSNSAIVANNLASLLSTYRNDDESLERAFNVARRLRGIEVPAFQDTYGWIAYRRGAYDEAVASLEPAAAGLPNDPLVQFHLGMAYLAAERPGDALVQLEKAVELAGEDPRPQFNQARETITQIRETEGQ